MKYNLLQTICRMSRYTFCAILIQATFAGVLVASEGSAQSNQKLDDIVLSLEVENMTLKNVFDQITELTDLKFAYEEGKVKLNQKIDLESSSKSLTNILKDISQENRLSFKRIGDQIFVQKHTGEPSVEDVRQVVPDVDITGKITDENGEGLPGASVVVKGTTNGITTNLDGNYKLTIPEDATIVMSFVGYKTIEMVVGSQSVIDVQLELDASQLEEVVVIGYGTQQRRDLTGAIASADLTDKTNTANVDIGQALQGIMAGVNVGVSTQAGGSPNIEIRGQNSLSGSQSPLIILDGIIFNGALSNINVSDVATLDILKDASAAAVYGARASNGVILITTKKGKSEKASFSFNAYKGVQDLSPTDADQIMNADQFLQRLVDYPHQEQLYGWYDTYQQAVLAGNTPPDQSTKPVVATPSTPEELEVYFRSPEEADNFRQGVSRNWIDETLRETAMVQNYDLSVSGRSKSSSYYLSGTYTEQEGLNENDQFERATMRANFTTDVKDWLSLGLNSSYSFRDYSGIEAPLDRALRASPWGSLRQGADPDDPAFNYTEVVAEDGVIRNPLSNTTAENDDLRDNLFIALKAKVDIPWVEGLSYEFNYSNTIDIRRNFTYYQSYTNQGASNSGQAERINEHNTSWLTNHLVTYSKQISDKHKLDITLLGSRENRRFTTTRLSSTGFDIESSGFNLPSLGINQTVNSGVAASQNRLAYMARAIYSYNNRYIVTATVRRDGFSAFATNNKTATFPSLSLAWVASDETFLKDVSWIDFMKARVSYGINGNDGIPRYASFATVDVGSTVLGQSVYTHYRPNALGNPDLKWETTASVNFGVDFDLFKERLTGSIDIYSSKTKDVIVERNLPRATGFSNILTNIGEVENSGQEISLKSINMQTADFSWSTTFAFSRNRNKLTKLLGGENDQDIGNQWFTGEPINSIYGYDMPGEVYTEAEFFAGNTPENFFPGHFKVTDIKTSEGNGLYNADDDRKILGYDDPNYRFGITNTLSYKNFTFSMFINSIQGGGGFYKANPGNLIAGGQDFARRNNQTAVRPYWTPTNPTADSPGIFWSQPVSGPLLLDRSFVRVQDISLSYNIPQSLLDRIGVSSMTIYASGKNVATFTNWTGWDPEIVGGLVNTVDPTNNAGNEQTLSSARPLPRTILLGVRLNF